MQIHPINDATPCFGVCCPRHGQCQRYAAVEGHAGHRVMDTCDPGDGSRPRFVSVGNGDGAARPLTRPFLPSHP